ncbi:MAG: LytTR family DNA-binding domain-containing protein [Bacteroidota bacterium]
MTTHTRIRAIIVEDEKQGMTNLVIKLEKYCPDIDLVAQCFDGAKAKETIEKEHPDLVFLDVQLGGTTGFDVLNKLSHLNFAVIFTTAHDEYAIRAIKVNAIDYLLKPIKADELQAAVAKAKAELHRRGGIRRIVVPHSEGYQYIPVEDILYCLADNNYAKIFRVGEKKMVHVSKTLKEIGNRLPADKFFKISRSAFVNLDYVEHFKRSSGGLVVIRGGDELSVSKERREELLRRLAQ